MAGRWDGVCAKCGYGITRCKCREEAAEKKPMTLEELKNEADKLGYELVRKNAYDVSIKYPKLKRPIHYDIPEISFYTWNDASNVLSSLSNIIGDYGIARVSDLYELSNLPSRIIDTEYGWLDLSGFGIKSVSINDYRLIIPTAHCVR